MKNVLRLLFVAALLSPFAHAALAQDAARCSQEAEAKAALYQKFLSGYKGTPDQQKAAYEAGTEYLNKYANCPDDADKQVAKFVQSWVTKYDSAAVEFNCSLAVNQTPARAYQACQPLLAKNPDDLKVYLLLITAGIKLVAAGDKSLNAQTAASARKALELIGQGKTSDSYAPFADRGEAVGGLNYYAGAFTYDTVPDEAAAALRRAAQSPGTVGKSPATFQFLGLAYYNGEVARLAQDYKGRCEGKPATPECDALYDKINQALDRVIDAFARAVALANANPQKYEQVLTQLKPTLTALYKQRHDNSDAGLDELVSGVLAKPLPEAK